MASHDRSILDDNDRDGCSFTLMEGGSVQVDTADHDRVMSWLQDRELKDNKLGLARSPRARVVDITTAIGRLQEVAYERFPDMERSALDALVRRYIDPTDRARERVPHDPVR